MIRYPFPRNKIDSRYSAIVANFVEASSWTGGSHGASPDAARDQAARNQARVNNVFLVLRSICKSWISHPPSRNLSTEALTRHTCLGAPMFPLARKQLLHGIHCNSFRRALSSVVDLRSDTVTAPSQAMLQTVLMARTGDDVMGEDPTVLELQEYTASLFGKDQGLFLPTGTMGNLCAVLAHCHERASEVILGRHSHINLYEGGNIANLGGLSSKQIEEDEETAHMSADQIRDVFREDHDDHYAKTTLLCLENTHNMLGGVALSPSYMDCMGDLTSDLNIPLHVDGARVFNAVVALESTPTELCKKANSVSVCLSKGLGAPLGTVLVGDREFIRLAKRARKRLGGGMRQAGVVAAMGLFALQHNVDRLQDDHRRAAWLANELGRHGFLLPRNGQIDTNIVYFALPPDSEILIQDFCHRLQTDFGVKLTGGYSRGGKYFRAVTHLDLDDKDVEKAIESIITLSRL